MQSITHTRASRFRLVVALAASGALGAAAFALPTDAHRADATSAGSAGSTVCGGLAADRSFVSQRVTLGSQHACEHLRAKQQSHAFDNASLAVSDAVSHARSAAALDGLAPADVGSWSATFQPPTKTVGISAVLLHTGKVLLFGGRYVSTDRNTAAYLYDPMTRTGHEVPAPAAVFCGSITQLSDGRVLSVGGADPIPKGIVDVYLFDPESEQWLRQPDTPLGRYYPSSTRLADGRVVVSAGLKVDGQTKNPKTEVYTPPPPGGVRGTLQVVGGDHFVNYYPLQFLMPDGDLMQVSGRDSYVLDPTTWNWSGNRRLPFASGQGAAGILVPDGPAGSNTVLTMGGLIKGAAQSTTQRFDHRNPAAGWRTGNRMPEPRAHMNLVLTPDGKAIGVGGNSLRLYEQGRPQTMGYDPETDRWTPLAVQSVRRAYHSTAVLLPDGRIMSAGDGGAGGGRHRIDYYSPPYLFQGPRPVITAAPRQVGHGATFQIGTAGPDVTRAVLMAPASTTHAVDMNMRHVELAVDRTAGGFTAIAPRATVGPPGWYMLFVLTPDGVPSVAEWVHVGP